jgi:hypothetical protein
MPVGTINLDSGVGYALGALCLVMLSVGFLRYTRDRRAGARDLTREERARLRDQQRVREGMEELLGQLEEVTRRIDADVDARITRLEGLLKAADERIRSLQRSNVAPAAREADPATAEADSSEAGGQGGAQAARKQRIYEMADTGASAITIADRLRLPVGEVELILNVRRFR